MNTFKPKLPKMTFIILIITAKFSKLMNKMQKKWNCLEMLLEIKNLI